MLVDTHLLAMMLILNPRVLNLLPSEKFGSKMMKMSKIGERRKSRYWRICLRFSEGHRIGTLVARDIIFVVDMTIMDYFCMLYSFKFK
jgi:hypothetical protein